MTTGRRWHLQRRRKTKVALLERRRLTLTSECHLVSLAPLGHEWLCCFCRTLFQASVDWMWLSFQEEKKKKFTLENMLWRIFLKETFCGCVRVHSQAPTWSFTWERNVYFGPEMKHKSCYIPPFTRRLLLLLLCLPSKLSRGPSLVLTLNIELPLPPVWGIGHLPGCCLLTETHTVYRPVHAHTHPQAEAPKHTHHYKCS